MIWRFQIVFNFTCSSKYRMNQTSPVIIPPVNCVNPTGLVGFTQLFFTRRRSADCVKPADLVGFTQLPRARLALTKRFFTQLGLIGGVDDKQKLWAIT